MSPCEKHDGELVLRLPIAIPGTTIANPVTITVTVCDACGGLFVPTDHIQKHKAALAARMLLAEQEQKERTMRLNKICGALIPGVHVDERE